MVTGCTARFNVQKFYVCLAEYVYALRIVLITNQNTSLEISQFIFIMQRTNFLWCRKNWIFKYCGNECHAPVSYSAQYFPRNLSITCQNIPYCNRLQITIQTCHILLLNISGIWQRFSILWNLFKSYIYIYIYIE